MDNDGKKLKFIRRLGYASYVADQVIGDSGGTVTDVPKTPTDALEVELDGQTYVLLAFKRKS